MATTTTAAPGSRQFNSNAYVAPAGEDADKAPSVVPPLMFLVVPSAALAEARGRCRPLPPQGRNERWGLREAG